MKRMNPKTGKPFKRGDVREDGYRFKCYALHKINASGFYAECWSSPDSYTKDKINNRNNQRLKRRSSREEHAKEIYINRKCYAKKSGVPFTATMDDVLAVLVDACPILGLPLSWCDSDGGKPKPTSPTMDRIDPMRGYVAGNIAWLSHKANSIKNNGTAAEHRAIADYMDQWLS